MPVVAREIHLAARPSGEPKSTDFSLVERELPSLSDGEVLVENTLMSVDPYMRGRMNDVKSYVPPFALNEPLQGGAIGRVVESRDPSLQPGDNVQHGLGWRSHVILAARSLQKIETTNVPLSHHLGVLGGTGLSAYVGLLDFGEPKAGETVFVSGAAGAVGSVAAQIAKIKGCRVVGSAGSPAKAGYLRDHFGLDFAFDYKSQDLEQSLSEGAPNGIDVYFDNVGGDHLQAALNHMNPYGRIAACGSISQYNNQKPVPGPNNLSAIVRQRLTVRGFIISDHMNRRADFLRDMSQWISAGQMKSSETIIVGLENAPSAFIGLLRGENIGKMLVRLTN